MQPRDLGRTVLLCATGGSADAIAFLRYDTFVGAMTGNTVLLGIDLAEGKSRPRRFSSRHCRDFPGGGHRHRNRIKAQDSACAAARPHRADAGRLRIHHRTNGARRSAPPRSACKMPRCAASPACRSIPSSSPATWSGWARRCRKLRRRSSRRRSRCSTIAWIAYAAGAVAGALALHLIDYPMIVPAVLALAAAIVEMSADRRDQG